MYAKLVFYPFDEGLILLLVLFGALLHHVCLYKILIIKQYIYLNLGFWGFWVEGLQFVRISMQVQAMVHSLYGLIVHTCSVSPANKL